MLERGAASRVISVHDAPQEAIAPLIPRFLPTPEQEPGFVLLLPWDSQYASEGQGEGTPLAADHAFAGGPSRFRLDGEGIWREEKAPAA